MSHRIEATAWRADEVVAWFAAVGAVSMVDGMRLSWGEDEIPYAVLSHPTDDPAASLARAIPDMKTHGAQTADMCRNTRDDGKGHPSVEHFAAVAERTRQTGRDDSLLHIYCDLSPKHKGDDARCQPAPMWAQRRGNNPYAVFLKNTLEALRIGMASCGSAEEYVRNAMTRREERSECGTGTGLGHGVVLENDSVPSGDFKPLLRPLVETVAWWGMSIMPLHVSAERCGTGGGVKVRGGRHRHRHVQSPWLFYPTWRTPLSWHGIDALLDQWHASWRPSRPDDGRGFRVPPRAEAERLGVTGAWAAAEILSGKGKGAGDRVQAVRLP